MFVNLEDDVERNLRGGQLWLCINVIFCSGQIRVDKVIFHNMAEQSTGVRVDPSWSYIA